MYKYCAARCVNNGRIEFAGVQDIVRLHFFTRALLLRPREENQLFITIYLYKLESHNIIVVPICHILFGYWYTTDIVGHYIYTHARHPAFCYTIRAIYATSNTIKYYKILYYTYVQLLFLLF